ncbi:hypothetical protein [Bradyrhizobium sp. STM 3557]|uniref:hypothetical protein n=1 Tax=Bradyrhizobium sp. STM 3557 TaxID=578920 RepID=UPI00388E0B86
MHAASIPFDRKATFGGREPASFTPCGRTQTSGSTARCPQVQLPDALEATSIDEALEVLEPAEIELTFLDLLMPGTTGLSGLVRIRKAFPRSPIVVVEPRHSLSVGPT